MNNENEIERQRVAEVEARGKLNEPMSNRPAVVEDEHLTYLDGLRESGITNMWGAGSYVAYHFSCSDKEASKILAYWMDSYGQDNR